MNYQEINAKTIDRWANDGWEWAKPIDHSQYVQASQGQWDVLLTPCKPVPKQWFGDLRGKKILGLASAGGQQMPIFAALGAECTVIDISDVQLSREKEVQAREGYSIEILKGDITKPLPFNDASFDLVFNPVSLSYIRELDPVFKEVFRVLKPGGSYLLGTDNGINFIVDEDESSIIFGLPFDPIEDETQRQYLLEQDAGMQFSHTIGEQIQATLRCGFTLVDLYEDSNGNGHLHELNIPSYMSLYFTK
ncbi:MAG: methyltransferase domain-containing protein [Eubacteriales bacterium]|nr:methyltransferase domain-containing protein [Eubacteriales bacterium]